MFVGHLALSLAATKADRQTPLAWFVVAANFVDLVWPVFLLLGIEHASVAPGNTAFTPLSFDAYPWTHSLLMGLVWGAALAALARSRGVSSRGAWLVGGLVVSHWLLDFITHAPDLPLWPGGGPRLGFGLWNSIPASFVVEAGLWIAALVLFVSVRRPVGARAWAALGSFVAVTTVLWAVSPFGPPPPDERTLALFALIGWSIIPWAWWIDQTWARR